MAEQLRQVRKMRRTVDAALLARRIEQVIVAAGGPKEVTYHLDIGKHTIWNYLRGRVPSFEVMVRLAAYAGVPLEWFLMPDDEASRYALEVGQVSYAEGRCTVRPPARAAAA